MNFDPQAYTVEQLTLSGETIRFRAFRHLPYVDRPVNPEFQQMNLFVPDCYYEGGSLHGYTLTTAPVFMPNSVGGYMPGPLAEPGEDRHAPGQPNSLFRALQHGYVVAAPAIRGRTQPGGHAPACIVDYKAAVRYLHHFAAVLPGDESRIITNGTSAGGALSALMGATGDHPDYGPALAALGAAPASDAVFAASCYCPITDLDHADMAYEWEFLGVNDFHRKHMRRNAAGRPSFTAVDGELTPLQIQTSRELAVRFPAYLNSLNLRDEAGAPLTLDEEGKGSFRAYIGRLVLASAQRALDRGDDLSGKSWLVVENGRAAAMDFDGWVRDITRMKTAPAFDDLTMSSPENNLFGTDETPYRHFTPYSRDNSLAGGAMAEPLTVRMMNPLPYLEDEAARKAAHWRIRHGECDRDTSLAVSAILACRLRQTGCQVDYHSPWDTPHSGDYDLDELFAWID
ncbi:MAG: subtype B tannase, partial [Gemmiger sp.]